jgi:hypothetical protein
LAMVIGYLINWHGKNGSPINWSNKTLYVGSVLKQQVKFKHPRNIQNSKWCNFVILHWKNLGKDPRCKTMYGASCPVEGWYLLGTWYGKPMISPLKKKLEMVDFSHLC